MARARLEAAAQAAGIDLRWAAPDGLAGAVAERRPDLVVIDLDAVGTQPLAALAGVEPRPRVVGYYSHVDADLGARARAAGCEAVPRGRFWAGVGELFSGLV